MMLMTASLVVAAVVEVSGRQAPLHEPIRCILRNEGNGSTTKYFNSLANPSQGFYSKPICEIMELAWQLILITFAMCLESLGVEGFS